MYIYFQKKYFNHIIFILFRYVTDPTDAKRLRASFAGLYPLDSSPEGEAAVKLALGNPEYYVMKPQREGGGNYNKYAFLYL